MNGPEQIADAAKAAGGSKTAKLTAAAAGAGGGFALVMLIVQRLSPEALERVLVNLGGPMIYSLVLLFLVFRFGNRGLSLLFQNTKHSADTAFAMNRLADGVQHMAKDNTERAVTLDSTINVLAVRSEATQHEVKNMRGELGGVVNQMRQVHGMMERIANNYEKGRAEARA